MFRYLFIANPISGKGRSLSQLKMHEAWVRAHLRGAEWEWTEGPQHATELARVGGKNKHDALVVFGGDGTFNEVLSGLTQIPAERRPPLALFTAGTGGDFCRTLADHFPIDKGLDWLKNPREIPIDFGRAKLWDAKGAAEERYFLNTGDVGLPGEVVHRVSRSGKFLRSLEYLRSTLAAAVQFKPPLVQVSGLEGGKPNKTQQFRILAVVAANGRYFGGGMCIAPDARLDDRLLDWVVIEKVSYWSLLLEFRHFYFKRKIPHPKVHYGRGKVLEVESLEGPLPIDFDGEFCRAQKVRFEVVPRGLRLLLPNG